LLALQLDSAGVKALEYLGSLPTNQEGFMHGPRIFSKEEVKLLRGETIKEIESVRGRPGYNNNDEIEIEFESGKKLHLDIYALYETRAVIKPAN
jgi:hypothetical protein